jgi:hypothetical protein
MKVKHYNEMMAYLTRPGFNGGGSVSNNTVLPKRKPAEEVKKRKKINYEKIKQFLGEESRELIERELGFDDGGRVGFNIGGFLNDNPEVKAKVIADLKNPKVELQTISDYIKSEGLERISPKSFSNFVSKNEEYSKVKNKPKGGAKGDPSDPARQATQKQNKYDRIKEVIDEAQDTGDINILKSKTRGTGGKLTNNQANILSDVADNPKTFDEMIKFTGMGRRELRDILNQRAENIADIKADIPIKQKRATPSVQLQESLLNEMFKGPSSAASIAKSLDKPVEEVQEGFSKLLKNIYAERVAMGKGKYATKGKSVLGLLATRDDEIIDRVLKNISNTKGLAKQQQYQFSELLYNAFGRKDSPTFNQAKYTKAMANYREYNQIKKVFEKYGIQLDLDHPLSKQAITDANLPADKLVRVTPISSTINRGLKEQFDRALIASPNNRANIRKVAKELGVTIGTIGEGGGARFGVKSFETFTPDEIAQAALTNIANEQNIATKLKNIDTKLLQKAGMENITAPVFDKQNFKKIAQDLRKAGFKCKFAGKDGGDVRCDDPMSYIDDMKRNQNMATQGSPEAKARAFTKFRAAKSFLTGTLGPAALAGEALFSVPFALYDYGTGANKEEIISNLTFGLGGKSQEEQLKELYGKNFGLADQAIATGERLDSLEKLQQGTRGQRVRSKGKFDIAATQFEEQISPFIKDGRFDEEAFQENRRITQQGTQKNLEEKAKRAEQRKDNLSGLEFDLGFAGGGVAKQAGVESGPAPESGPTPDGPKGLFSAIKYAKKQ